MLPPCSAPGVCLLTSSALTASFTLAPSESGPHGPGHQGSAGPSEQGQTSPSKVLCGRDRQGQDVVPHSVGRISASCPTVVEGTPGPVGQLTPQRTLGMLISIPGALWPTAKKQNPNPTLKPALPWGHQYVPQMHLLGQSQGSLIPC